MHGVVLSKGVSDWINSKLEVAMGQVEISGIGLQHALVFRWQKIHIISVVLEYLG